MAFLPMRLVGSAKAATSITVNWDQITGNDTNYGVSPITASSTILNLLRGDIDGNGTVNINDAMTSELYLVNQAAVSLNVANFASIDPDLKDPPGPDHIPYKQIPVK